MVFSVEPGLYVAADDERAPAALRGTGVRIEDDILITTDGAENLNADIPKQPAEVEAWVNAAGDAGDGDDARNLMREKKARDAGY